MVTFLPRDTINGDGWSLEIASINLKLKLIS